MTMVRVIIEIVFASINTVFQEIKKRSSLGSRLQQGTIKRQHFLEKENKNVGRSCLLENHLLQCLKILATIGTFKMS